MQEALYDDPRAGQVKTLGGANANLDSSPALAPQIERVLIASNLLDNMVHDISARADRLFGGIPQEANVQSGPRAVPSGEFGRLADAIDQLENTIGRLQSADQRLSSL